MLELYQAEGCGYSAKVRETLTDLGVSYVIHNPRSAAGETRNEQTHNQTHQNWIDEHTTNGTLAEIREALTEHTRPRR